MKFTMFALAAGFLVSSLAAEEEGFVQLFDGKTFEGWKVAENEKSFTIEDGAFVAKGDRAHCFYVGKDGGVKFEDFELRLEAMTKPNSNGGVFIHTEWQDNGWPAKGYEVQVNNTQSDWRKSGGLYGIVDNKEPFKDDEWMQYVIRVEDGVVNVTVNGKEVVKDFKPEGDQDKLQEGGGTIALQAHDPGSTIYYKNIRLKKLD